MSRAAGLALLAALAAGACAAQPVAPAYSGVRLGGVVESDVRAEAAGPRAAHPAAPSDDWIARDKALHLGASFLLVLSGQYVLTDKADLSDGRALPVSAATTLALGLVKEVADSRRDRNPLFSWRDLAANATGVALAALVVGL